MIEKNKKIEESAREVVEAAENVFACMPNTTGEELIVALRTYLDDVGEDKYIQKDVVSAILCCLLAFWRDLKYVPEEAVGNFMEIEDLLTQFHPIEM